MWSSERTATPVGPCSPEPNCSPSPSHFLVSSASLLTNSVRLACPQHPWELSPDSHVPPETKSEWGWQANTLRWQTQPQGSWPLYPPRLPSHLLFSDFHHLQCLTNTVAHILMGVFAAARHRAATAVTDLSTVSLGQDRNATCFHTSLVSFVTDRQRVASVKKVHVGKVKGEAVIV